MERFTHCTTALWIQICEDHLVRGDIGVADGGGPAEEVHGLVAAAVALELPVPQGELVVLAAAEPSEPSSAVVEVTPDHHDGRHVTADRVVRDRDERLGGI